MLNIVNLSTCLSTTDVQMVRAYFVTICCKGLKIDSADFGTTLCAAPQTCGAIAKGDVGTTSPPFQCTRLSTLQIPKMLRWRSSVAGSAIGPTSTNGGRARRPSTGLTEMSAGTPTTAKPRRRRTAVGRDNEARMSAMLKMLA